MTDQHLTPPLELVQQWANSSPIQPNDENWAYELYIAHQAAQWGADQELDACCEWLVGWCIYEYPAGIENLRASRRPKPRSLKERALKGLDVMIANGHLDGELAAALREVLEASHD